MWQVDRDDFRIVGKNFQIFVSLKKSKFAISESRLNFFLFENGSEKKQSKN